MPKLLFARAARDAGKERQPRKLAGARHAPGDWITRARIVVSSWDRMPVASIAERLGCHPQTVRRRLQGFKAEGTGGLGRPGLGDYRQAAVRPLAGGYRQRLPFTRFFSSDPSGRYLLLDAGPASGTANAWIDDGRPVQLTPANGTNIFYEAR